MQSVTLEHDGQFFDLGNILPIAVDGTIQYLIIPTFQFSPPFLCLRLVHAHRRMGEMARRYLQKGEKLPRLVQKKPFVIEPLHTLKF